MWKRWKIFIFMFVFYRCHIETILYFDKQVEKGKIETKKRRNGKKSRFLWKKTSKMFEFSSVRFSSLPCFSPTFFSTETCVRVKYFCFVWFSFCVCLLSKKVNQFFYQFFVGYHEAVRSCHIIIVVTNLFVLRFRYYIYRIFFMHLSKQNDDTIIIMTNQSMETAK